MTSSEWREIEAALVAGIEPLIHIDLLHDASEHRRLGDLQRAVLTTAMACEAYFRQLLHESLPLDLSPMAAETLLKSSIKTLRSRLVRDVLTTAVLVQLDALREPFDRLFESRNKIVHHGRDGGITKWFAEESHGAAKSLFNVKPLPVQPPLANCGRY